jgi:hypothetical protein
MIPRSEWILGQPKEVDYELLNQDSVPIDIYSPAAPQNPWQKVWLPQGPVDRGRFKENYKGLQDNRQALEDPLTGNRVVVHWANVDQLDIASKGLVVIVTTRNSSLDTNGGNRREYAIVSAMNPEHPFAIVDIPGAGLSDRLPRKVKRELLKTGSFISASEIVVRALETMPYLPSYYTGTGSGGRIAIAAGAASETGQIRRISAIDPEGQSDLGFVAQQKAFLRELTVHEPNARKVTEDPYADPHNNFPDLPEAWQKNAPLSVAARYIVARSLWQQFVSLPRALSHGQNVLQTDIEAALEQQPHAFLDYISPEKSELLKDPDDPIKTLGALSSSQVVRTRVLRVVRIPEATHYFTAAHPRFVGALLHETLADLGEA